MSAENDSDPEASIEELLQGLENTPVSPTPFQAQLAQPTKSNLKDSSGSRNTASQYRGNEIVDNTNDRQQSKSVRFSSDDILDSKQPANRSVTKMAAFLFPDDEDTKKVKPSPQQDIMKAMLNEPETQKSRKQVNKKKDDWLGLDDDDDSPLNSLDNLSALLKHPVISSKVPTTTSENIQRKMSEELDIDTSSLVKMLASRKDQSTTSMLDTESRKPPIPLNLRNTTNLGSGRRNNYSDLSDSATSRAQSPSQIGTAVKPPISYILEKSAENNQMKSQELYDIQQPIKTNPRSFLDSLPFMTKTTANIDSSMSAAGDSVQDINNPSASGNVVTKKKVMRIVGANPSTLHLPSHLVNEDELKMMSSSLKTLYANQLEMLENSYKEQIDFISLSNKRREELLKDEMNSLRDDYEQRIQRLRAELVKTESLSPEKVQQEILKLATQFENLSSKLDHARESNLNNITTSLDLENLKATLSDELKKTAQKQTESIATRIQGSLLQDVQKCLKDCMSEQQSQFEDIRLKMEKAVDTKDNNYTKILDKIDATEKNRQGETEKWIKIQKRLKDNGVSTAVDSVVKIVEAEKDESKRKGDRLAVQIKEFRKDLRRFYSELENKNDSVHKSQLSIEMEQRTITQAIRDINTILKLTTTKYQSQNIPNPNDNNMMTNFTNQFTAMQALQQQTQNEMEIKLMKEERKSLSESIAQMNVERRKLADEKLAIERERLEFEKEKTRVRELEMHARMKTTEAEELKRNAELLRQQETRLTQEADSKLHDMTKEKSRFKERLFELEQKLIMREQKLFQDKSELLKEKEFMDKLRDQLLCPGCLNSVKGISSLLNLAPPPYNSSPMRSNSDGIDIFSEQQRVQRQLSHTFSTFTMPKLNLSPEEDAYYRNKNKYLLDQLNSQPHTDL